MTLNLTAAEVIARNLQYTEYEMKKRNNKRPVGDMSDWFLGRCRRYGSAIICLDFLKYVSTKSLKDCSFLKESRKLEFKRAELAKKKGGKPSKSD